MPEVREFVVSRPKWLRNGHPKCDTTIALTLWDKEKGGGCILGHYLHACGVSLKALDKKSWPGDLARLPKQAAWLSENTPEGTFADTIVNLNDRDNHDSGRSIRPYERERNLVAAFRKHNISLVFVD